MMGEVGGWGVWGEGGCRVVNEVLVCVCAMWDILFDRVVECK